MKFRRKQASSVEPGVEDPLGGETTAPEELPSGPFDSAEVSDDVERVDLGSLLVPPVPGRELRLQVEESTGAVRSVLLAGEDGALEIQAFAAPRHGDLWSEVRPQIAADVAQRGGTATEREGRFGTELVCQVPVTLPDGKAATQPSRVMGVNGERWLLRVSLLGRPALEPDGAQEWEDAVAQLVVHRGTEAMPVGEPLPVRLPDQARRVDRATGEPVAPSSATTPSRDGD